jgi:hypothetical protein
MREIKEQFWSIVLRGDLNPRIFQPYWYAAQGLLGKDAAESAQIDIVHRDVSHFTLDWLDVQVFRDRFSSRTLQGGHEEALRDFVLGTFKLLRHTPVGIMGVNFVVHFSVDSVEEWHAIGHRLVPKEGLWASVLESPGTRSLLIEGKRPDGEVGYVRVKVEPSEAHHPGVFVEINDHFDRRLEGRIPPVSVMMDILSSQWSASVERAQKIVGRLMELR